MAWRTSRRCFLQAGYSALALGAESKPIQLFNGRDLDGWYTWLRESHYEDPKKVFSVKDGILRVSGEEWGGLATRKSYSDYHLIVEWRWGGPAHGERQTKARDSGILVHASGRDGAHANTWLESIECQIIEGGCGDFILVNGDAKPSLSCETRVGSNKDLYWQKGGTPVTRNAGRFDWFGRDPEWKDALGFRGREDIEKPTGEWNRSEVIARGSSLTNLVNGVIVNQGTGATPAAGKIQLQSEGAEIHFRRVEMRPIS